MSLAIFRKRAFFFSAALGAETATAPTQPFSWTKDPRTAKEDTKFVPLDEVLQVRVVEKAGLRSAVREYVCNHIDHPGSVRLASGRGKLIAALLDFSGRKIVFGDLVKSVNSGLQASEYALFHNLDARELARTICRPAVEVR